MPGKFWIKGQLFDYNVKTFQFKFFYTTGINYCEPQRGKYEQEHICWHV